MQALGASSNQNAAFSVALKVRVPSPVATPSSEWRQAELITIFSLEVCRLHMSVMLANACALLLLLVRKKPYSSSTF